LNNIKPINLFSFATKELTQDAFIAWLSSWACVSQAERSKPLHLTGRKLLAALFSLHRVTLPQEIQNVKSQCQFKRADILIEVNDNYVLMIEDKIHDSERGEQLSRTLEAVKAHYKEKGQYQVLPIYFKTGDQSDLEKVFESEYKIFDRKAFLEILKFGIQCGVTSDIFMDYYDWLQHLEDDVEAYRTMPLSQWQFNQWKGFFKALKSTRKFLQSNWDYVSNPQGGFMGFWWGFQDLGENCSLYLQIEEKKLCFKIEVPKEMEASKKKQLQLAWSERIIEAARNKNQYVHAFNLRIGRWMTVASLHEDSFIGKSEGVLDFEKTVMLLKSAEEIVNLAIQQQKVAA
jgi:hypothetical protein